MLGCKLQNSTTSAPAPPALASAPSCNHAGPNEPAQIPNTQCHIISNTSLAVNSRMGPPARAAPTCATVLDSKLQVTTLFCSLRGSDLNGLILSLCGTSHWSFGHIKSNRCHSFHCVMCMDGSQYSLGLQLAGCSGPRMAAPPSTGGHCHRPTDQPRKPLPGLFHQSALQSSPLAHTCSVPLLAFKTA